LKSDYRATRRAAGRRRGLREKFPALVSWSTKRAVPALRSAHRSYCLRCRSCTESLRLVCLEHALYGNLLFAASLWPFFSHEAVIMW